MATDLALAMAVRPCMIIAREPSTMAALARVCALALSRSMMTVQAWRSRQDTRVSWEVIGRGGGGVL